MTSARPSFFTSARMEQEKATAPAAPALDLETPDLARMERKRRKEQSEEKEKAAQEKSGHDAADARSEEKK